MADEWARSSSIVSGMPCGLSDEKVEMLSISRTILGVGLERLPPRVASVFAAI
jgi:hypothetical protein